MSRFYSRTMPAWLMGGLSVLMLTQPGLADEPGVASTRSVMQQSITPANHMYCPNCPVVDYGYGGGYCPDGNCQSGYCPGGYCQNGYCPGYYGPSMCDQWGHWWGTGCHQCGHKLHNIINWLHPQGLGTVSPDHGWAPPGKVPMHTVYVPYQKLYPNEWTGQPSNGTGMSAAAIYMPTDTTQLGYYYQHAPAWRPAAAPGAPIPSQWHRPLCGPGGNGMCQGGVIYGQMCPGEVFSEGEPTPADQETAPPAPLPADELADPLGATATFLSPRIAN